MKVNARDKFVSRQTTRRIRVTSVVRSIMDSRHDLCFVVDLHNNGRPVAGTQRVILADSIRRRYF